MPRASNYFYKIHCRYAKGLEFNFMFFVNMFNMPVVNHNVGTLYMSLPRNRQGDSAHFDVS